MAPVTSCQLQLDLPFARKASPMSIPDNPRQVKPRLRGVPVPVFAQYAPEYLELGWSPIPANGKNIIPKGVTGRKGRDVDADDVDEWAVTHATSNIALRMPKGCIGIDIDDYDDKQGGATIAALEGRLGPLPEVYKVTSRARSVRGRSGIILFRLPRSRKDAVLPGIAGPGVELIQWHHRYFIAPPSRHPDSGAIYKVITDGPVSSSISFSPSDLPVLPVAWVNALASGEGIPAATDGARLPLRDLETDCLDAPSGSQRTALLAYALECQRQFGDAGAVESVYQLARRMPQFKGTEWDTRSVLGLIKPGIIPDDDGELDDLMREAEDERRFDVDVAGALHRLRVSNAARSLLHSSVRAEAPEVVGLDEFLSESDEDVSWLVDGVLGDGWNAVLVAQAKAGKTTMVNNLVRCLVDGDVFLGSYPCKPIGSVGKVGILDFELDRRTSRSMLRGQGISCVSDLALWHLRGCGSSFNIVDAGVRTEWAERFLAAGVVFPVLDCLRPALVACGLEEDNSGMSRILECWNELLLSAGCVGSLVVHHMGHTQERGRSGSVLRDWPDVEWKIVRPSVVEGVDDMSSPRYFSAYGRGGVDEAESALALDDNGRLSTTGLNRVSAVSSATDSVVLGAITRSPGIRSRELQLTEGVRKENVAPAVRRLRRAGKVCTHTVGRPVHHYADGACPAPGECDT